MCRVPLEENLLWLISCALREKKTPLDNKSTCAHMTLLVHYSRPPIAPMLENK